MKPLIPLPPFLAACRQRARPGDRVTEIDLIGIPTANRVPTFARAARSYLANARDFGRKPELTVADDSADPEVGAEYRRLLAGLAREFAVPVSYAGPAEKQAYAAHLAREAGVAPALVEFALGNPFRIGYRPGANRNALLLQSAGRALFSADDDTVCRPAPGPGKPWSLRLTDVPDPTNVRPYESLKAWSRNWPSRRPTSSTSTPACWGRTSAACCRTDPTCPSRSASRASCNRCTRTACAWP